jgi:predicted ArsR family transcriptional regulator
MGAVKQTATPAASLGVIVSHPLRTRCWTILTERTASPKDIAEILDEDLSQVSYHVRALKKYGCVELVRARPVKGRAVEHRYRAVVRAYSDDEDTASRSLENRTDLARHTCQVAFADASIALDENTFCERADHYVVRIPAMLDEEGWREYNAAYSELVEKLMEAGERTANRAAEAGEAPAIKTTAIAMFFEMPPQPK